MTASWPVPGDACDSGIVPVTSPDAEGAPGGMAAEAVLSLDVARLKDCRPIGTGDVIEGSAEPALPLPGEAGEWCIARTLPRAGTAGGAAVSSSVIAIFERAEHDHDDAGADQELERIFEVMVEDVLA